MSISFVNEPLEVRGRGVLGNFGIAIALGHDLFIATVGPIPKAFVHRSRPCHGMNFMHPRKESPPRVLIAEDDPDCRWVLGALLNRHGYECQTVRDGAETVDAAHSFSPNAILMDLLMPVVDGLEATRQLKSDVLTAAIPILALTANITRSGEQAARTAGCDDVMGKPVTIDSVLEWLKTHLLSDASNEDPPERC